MTDGIKPYSESTGKIGLLCICILVSVFGNCTLSLVVSAASITIYGGTTFTIIYFVGSQFSNNSKDGRLAPGPGEPSYYEKNFASNNKLYIKGGPGCCQTGISSHGQKLNAITHLVQKYYDFSHYDLNVLKNRDISFKKVPSLFEWAHNEICQRCLLQNPSHEALWLGTAIGSSLQYFIRLLHEAVNRGTQDERDREKISGRIKDSYAPLIVGPTAALETTELLRFASYYRLIFIGYSTPDFDRSIDPFPYFFNVVPNHNYPSKATSATLEYLKWCNQLTILYVNESWSKTLATNIYKLIEAKDSVYMAEVQDEYDSMANAVLETTYNTDANRTIVLIGRKTQKIQSQSLITNRNPVYSLMCILARTTFDVKNQNALVIVPEQGEDLLVTAKRSCYAGEGQVFSDCDCTVAEISKVIKLRRKR